MEAAFHFWYVKDQNGMDGIKIKGMRIYADPMPALGFMLQNTEQDGVGQGYGARMMISVTDMDNV